jgi:site-specific recombinase XerD
LSALKKFFALLKEHGVIVTNPADRLAPPLREKKEPLVLQKTEYKALLYAASSHPRDFAIVQVFLQTGIRVSELAGLEVSDVDMVSRTLFIRQGKRKKDRTIPLEEQAIGALRAYLPLRDALALPDCTALFVAKNGTSLDVRSIRYLVKKYMKKADIKKRASVHTLRHTCATHKVDNGMTIPALQKLLGHERIQTTYGYVHLATASFRKQQEQTAL